MRVQVSQNHHKHKANRNLSLEGNPPLEGRREFTVSVEHSAKKCKKNKVHPCCFLFFLMNGNGAFRSSLVSFYFLPTCTYKKYILQLWQKHFLCKFNLFWCFASAKPLTWVRPCFCKSLLSINPEGTHGWVACETISRVISHKLAVHMSSSSTEPTLGRVCGPKSDPTDEKQWASLFLVAVEWDTGQLTTAKKTAVAFSPQT